MAVLLGGCSYPLLLYFSEARGYGPAMFFSLACYFLLLEKVSTDGLKLISQVAYVSFWLLADIQAFGDLSPLYPRKRTFGGLSRNVR